MTALGPQKAVLSPRDLARALGVSESSVKRWVDDGALEAVKTTGGHRRIPLAAAVRFIRRTGTPVLEPELLTGSPLPTAVASIAPSSSPEAVSEELWRALHGDDPAAGRALILSLYMAGWSVAAICDGPIRGVLARIGELWHHGDAGIFIEHRATDTCLQALAELRTMLPGGARVGTSPVALGAAPAGDPYLLPSLMAALVLADQGFAERNLGAHTPTPVLAMAARHYKPRLVWIACAIEPKNPRELATELDGLARSLRRAHGELVIGGRGVHALGPLPAGVHALGSMAELAAFGKGLIAAG